MTLIWTNMFWPNISIDLIESLDAAKRSHPRDRSELIMKNKKYMMNVLKDVSCKKCGAVLN